ncbi:unnamed protein product [Camellia sinensis]
MAVGDNGDEVSDHEHRKQAKNQATTIGSDNCPKQEDNRLGWSTSQMTRWSTGGDFAQFCRNKEV